MKDYIIGFITILIVFYLVGAFTSASFNIQTWDPTVRAFVGWLGLIIAFMSVGIINDIKKY